MQGRSWETFKTEDGGSQNACCLASGPESTSPAALRDGGKNHGSVPPPHSCWNRGWQMEKVVLRWSCMYICNKGTHFLLRKEQSHSPHPVPNYADWFLSCPLWQMYCKWGKKACWSFLSNKPKTLCKCQCSSTQTREDRSTLNTITTEKRAF